VGQQNQFQHQRASQGVSNMLDQLLT